MIKKLLALSIFGIFFLQSPAIARDRIQNHLLALLAEGDFETTVSQSIPIYFQGNSSTVEESAIAIHTAMEKMLAFTNYREIDTCQDVDIKIFVMDHRLLHDRSIMNFLTWESMPPNIWGAYDSFHDQETGEFYINGSASPRFTKRIFAHEFWHHVQDITCQPRSESEADDFSNRFCTVTGEC